MEVFVGDSAHTADILGASPNYRHYNWLSAGSHEPAYEEPTHPFTIWCVEVKVSYADFKNGYADRGCNKHYILAPKGLLDPKVDLPKHVGLLEYDETVRPAIHNGYPQPSVPCLKVKKKCQRQEIDDKTILRHIGRMGDMATTNMTRLILDKQKELWVLTSLELQQMAIVEQTKEQLK
jgi:hypothetical protein